MEYIRYLFEERVKKCSCCKEIKSYACFYNRKTQSDGKRTECVECGSKWLKKYRNQHKTQMREYYQQYQQQHRLQKREYIRNKRQNDQIYKLTANIRSRIRMAIKHHLKSAHTLELLACDINKFIEYLKYQCEQDNLDINSNLHIDHIVPCSKFDLSNSEQQKLCFYWKNLRYCPASENLSKSDKIDEALIEKYKQIANDFELLYNVE